tara:strand:+ start:962 stop:1735 length:774 start_codon:yes stop_codon:yes gene_type:complete
VISKLASVHPEAKLAGNITVEAFAVIESDVEIGEGSIIYSHSSILAGTRLGKNCRVFQGAVVGGIPQDLKFEGEYSQVIIGDNTTVRECATINRGTKAFGRTIIGRECLIMANVHVAHDCILGDHVILVNSVALAGHVEIGDWSIIGGLSAVHQFVKVGPHVMVGGGSLVRKDIPPFITVAREPLSYEGVNILGLRRRGFNNARIEEIHHTYRLVYQSGLNTTQAISQIEIEVNESPEISDILNFLHSSDRGIVKNL